MGHQTIYADYQATTPTDPRVLMAMLPYWQESFGNPHSNDHTVGWQAAELVSVASQIVGELIGADSDEIIFTSGATEANNLALSGLARSLHFKRRKILVSAIEHKCVLETAHALTRLEKHHVEIIPVNEQGQIELGALQGLLDDSVLLVSVMAVNNEIGTIQDIPKVSAMAKSSGALVHCDAAQAPCAMKIREITSHVDLLSLSGHKIYGPQGIGVLYVRRDIQRYIEPLLRGGGQQHGLRSGTVPIALCAGMAEASRLMAQPEASEERTRVAAQRDRFVSILHKCSFPIIVNGPGTNKKHPGNINIQFPGFSAQDILGITQPKLAASTGAACTSGTPKTSHVLRAIGLNKAQRESSIRFSFGRYTTDSDIEDAAHIITEVLENMAKDQFKKTA